MTGGVTGGELIKGILRTAFFLGLGSLLALWVFRFGLDLAGVVGAGPLATATHETASWVQDVVQAPNVAVGLRRRPDRSKLFCSGIIVLSITGGV